MSEWRLKQQWNGMKWNIYTHTHKHRWSVLIFIASIYPESFSNINKSSASRKVSLLGRSMRAFIYICIASPKISFRSCHRIKFNPHLTWCDCTCAQHSTDLLTSFDGWMNGWAFRMIQFDKCSHNPSAIENWPSIFNLFDSSRAKPSQSWAKSSSCPLDCFLQRKLK